MRKGLERQLLDAVSQFFEAGEQPVMSTMGTLGTHSVKEMTRGAVRESLSTLGTSFTLHLPRNFFLLLTDRRLLFVESATNTNRPLPNIVAQLPRNGLRLAPARSGLMKSFDVIAPEGAPIVRLNFALPQRADGAQLAALINGAATQ